ncbi:MAG: GNAT family N-acetyltransferase [Clostridia bacterium]|nr:GNAT family N-acetyltransferase [Clostridia bacterium]
MRIRLAAESDAGMLMQLNRAFNEVDDVGEADIRAALGAGREVVAVAEEAGVLIGFCCAQVHHSFCYNAPCAEITEMYVDAAHRKKGAGRAMLAFMTEHLQGAYGVCEMHLLTGCENEAAKALYGAMGFEEKKEAYMRKKLEGST